MTGIVVNQRPNVARPEYDRLRAVLHDCVTRGPTAANRERRDDLRAHLLGRISWVAALNPGRGAKLRAVFDAVAWDERSPNRVEERSPTTRETAMGHHDDDGTEHPVTENTAAEPAVKDGTDPNDPVVSDDIDQQMLQADIDER